jgi:superfamily II helicase
MASSQVWEDIEQSIDLALTCNIDIIVTGDCNVNMLRNTSNDKISNLKNQFSLHQLISDPTYVTEHSSSLLDFNYSVRYCFVCFICTIERVIESISSDANKLSKLTCESCSRSELKSALSYRYTLRLKNL